MARSAKISTTKVTAKMAKDIGHVSAVSITSGVTVLPIETPISTNTTSRNGTGIKLFSPNIVATETAAAGPVNI